MNGICSDDSYSGIHLQEQLKVIDTLFDFIVLPGTGIHGKVASPTTVWDTRAINPIPELGTKLDTKQKLKQLEKRSETKSKIKHFKACARFNRKIRKRRCPFTKSLKVSERFNSLLSSGCSRGVKQNRSFHTLKTKDHASGFDSINGSPVVKCEFIAADEVGLKDRGVKSEKSQGADHVTEFPDWFLVLKPSTGSWAFEFNDTALARSLKTNMAATSEGRSCGLEQILVSYTRDSSPEHRTTGQETNTGETEDSSSPHSDSLYEVAVQFAKTHGYGFVKLVEEETEIVDEESARQMRRKRELRRKAARRRAKLKEAAVRPPNTHNSARASVPASNSSLKLGKASCRGLYGGRLRDPNAPWTSSSPKRSRETACKHENEAEMVSREIREALTAEAWLNASPDCREHIRRCFRRQQAKEHRGTTSVSPTRPTHPQNLSHASGKSDYSSQSPLQLSTSKSDWNKLPSVHAQAEHSESSPRKSQYHSEKCIVINSGRRGQRQATPKQHFSSPRDDQDRSQKQVEEKHSAGKNGYEGQRSKSVKHCAEEARERKRSASNCMLRSTNPAQQYRELLKEMCDMIDSGFFRVWPKEFEVEGCGNRSPQSDSGATSREDNENYFCRTKEKILLKPHKNCKSLQSLLADDMETNDSTSAKIANEKNCGICESSGDDTSQSSEGHSNPEQENLWLPKVTNKHTNKQYRLCNSLSATIFRESKFSSASLSELGGPPKMRLPTAPLEIVYVDGAEGVNTLPDGEVREECSATKGLKSKETNVYSSDCATLEDKKDGRVRVVEDHIPPGVYTSDKNCIITEANQEVGETPRSIPVELDLLSTSATRCVRNRRNSHAITPHLLQASMSRSCHLVTSSSVKAGSCPNLAAHTSKLHRNPSLRAFSLHRSVSPKPKWSWPDRDSSSLGSDCANETPTQNYISSAIIGDHGSFSIDSTDTVDNKSSVCLTSLDPTHVVKDCLHHEQSTNKDIHFDSLVPPAQGQSPEVVRHNSPRRKCTSPLRNVPLQETPPAPEEYVEILHSDRHSPSSPSSSELDNSQRASHDTSIEHDECSSDLSESFHPLVHHTDNVNNNAPSGHNDIKSVVDDISSACSGSLRNKAPVFFSFQGSRIPIGVSHCMVTNCCNNNAFVASDTSDKNDLPDVPVTSGRRKWGPAVESPDYHESTSCRGDHSLNKHISHQDHEPLKLPALPNPNKSYSNKQDTETLCTLQNRPKDFHKNSFLKYESMPVGFGAAPPMEEGDECFGVWETQTHHKESGSVKLPPATRTQSQSQAPSLRAHVNMRNENGSQKKGARAVGEQKQGKPRSQPLNKSYVISRDDDWDGQTKGEHVLKLPAPTRDCNFDRQQISKPSCTSSTPLEGDNSKSRDYQHRIPFSTERLEVETCNSTAQTKKTSLQPKPHVSLRSPEFSSGWDRERCEVCTRAGLSLSSECIFYEQTQSNNTCADWNNNSSETKAAIGNQATCKDEKSIWLPKIPRVSTAKDKRQENVGSDSKCGASLLYRNTIGRGVNRLIVNAWAEDTLKNISNNASHPPEINGCSSEDTRSIISTSDTSQHQQELQTGLEMSSVSALETGNLTEHTKEVRSSPLHTRNSGGCDATLRATIASRPGDPSVWRDINNGSSMNQSRGREREFLCRRHIQSESSPADDLLINEIGNTEDEETPPGEVSPMEDTDTQGYLIPTAQSSGSHYAPVAPVSQPLRPLSSEVWRNTLSQDPMNRRLWSCENHQQSQEPEEQRHRRSFTNLNQRIPNNPIPYCPTTENYWQMALDPNAPAPSLDFLQPDTPTARIQEPICSMDPLQSIYNDGLGSQGSIYQESEVMDVTGDREPTDTNAQQSHVHSFSHNPGTAGERVDGLSSFAELYRQLDTLWMRSQNQLSQRLEALGHSMNTRLKQLQLFVERHIPLMLRANSSNYEHQSQPPFKHKARFNSHSSIHLTRKAGRIRRPPYGFPLDTSKYRKKKAARAYGDTALNNSKGESASTQHSATDVSPACQIFPTIKFKEVKAESTVQLSESGHQTRIAKTSSQGTNQTTQGSPRNRRGHSPTYKSFQQWKREANNPVAQHCAMKQGKSVTCGCNQKHTRRCRRRRGSGGDDCNMCLLARMPRLGNRKQSSSKRLGRQKLFHKNRSSKRRILKGRGGRKQAKANVKRRRPLCRSNTAKRNKTRATHFVNGRKKVNKLSVGKSGAKRALKQKASYCNSVSQSKNPSKRDKRCRMKKCVSKAARLKPQKVQRRLRRSRVNQSLGRGLTIQATARTKRKVMDIVCQRKGMKRHNDNLKPKSYTFCKPKRAITENKLHLTSAKLFQAKRLLNTKRTNDLSQVKTTHPTRAKRCTISSKPATVPCCRYKVSKRDGGLRKLSVTKKREGLRPKSLRKAKNQKSKCLDRRKSCALKRKDKSNSCNKKLQCKKGFVPMTCMSNNCIYDVVSPPQRFRYTRSTSKPSTSNRNNCSMASRRRRPTCKSTNRRFKVPDADIENNFDFSRFKLKNVSRRERKPTAVKKGMRYTLTATGYNSLINSLRSRYRNLRANTHQDSDRNRREKAKRFVEDIKNAVSGFLRTRLNGLRFILGSAGRSKNTTSREPGTVSEQTTPDGYRYYTTRQYRKLAASRSRKHRVLSQGGGSMQPSGSKRYRSVVRPRESRGGKLRVNKSEFTTAASPPKPQARHARGGEPLSFKSFISIPWLWTTTAAKTTKLNPEPQRESSSISEASSSNHTVKPVDSLELHRRRLLRRSKNISCNACFCENSAFMTTGERKHYYAMDSFPFNNSPKNRDKLLQPCIDSLPEVYMDFSPRSMDERPQCAEKHIYVTQRVANGSGSYFDATCREVHCQNCLRSSSSFQDCTTRNLRDCMDSQDVPTDFFVCNSDSDDVTPFVPTSQAFHNQPIEALANDFDLNVKQQAGNFTSELSDARYVNHLLEPEPRRISVGGIVQGSSSGRRPIKSTVKNDSDSFNGKSDSAEQNLFSSSLAYASTVDYKTSRRDVQTLQPLRSYGQVCSDRSQNLGSCLPKDSVKKTYDVKIAYPRVNETKRRFGIGEKPNDGYNSKSRIVDSRRTSGQSSENDLKDEDNYDNAGNSQLSFNVGHKIPPVLISKGNYGCPSTPCAMNEQTVTNHHPTLVLKYPPFLSTGKSLEGDDLLPPKATKAEMRGKTNLPCASFLQEISYKSNVARDPILHNSLPGKSDRRLHPAAAQRETNNRAAQKRHDESKETVAMPALDYGALRRPYLKVKCSAIRTAWVSFERDGPFKHFSRTVTNREPVEQLREDSDTSSLQLNVSDKHNEPLSGNHSNVRLHNTCTKEQLVIKSCWPLEPPPGKLRNDYRKNESLTGATESITNVADSPCDERTLENPEQTFRQENRTAPSAQKLSDTNSSCSVFDTAAQRGCFAQNMEYRSRSVPHFETDDLLLLPANEAPGAVWLRSGVSSSIGANESACPFQTVSSYPQRHGTDWPGDDVTVSTESSRENNNNAVRTHPLAEEGSTKRNNRCSTAIDTKENCRLLSHPLGILLESPSPYHPRATSEQLKRPGPCTSEAKQLAIPQSRQTSTRPETNVGQMLLSDSERSEPTLRTFKEFSTPNRLDKIMECNVLCKPPLGSAKERLGARVSVLPTSSLLSKLDTSSCVVQECCLALNDSSSTELTLNPGSPAMLGKPHFSTSNSCYCPSSISSAGFQTKVTPTPDPHTAIKPLGISLCARQEKFTRESAASNSLAAPLCQQPNAAQSVSGSSGAHVAATADQLIRGKSQQSPRHSRDRKRRLVCPLWENLAPPRKVPRMDTGVKSLSERRRWRHQRRAKWQQERERRYQALREEERNRRRCLFVQGETRKHPGVTMRNDREGAGNSETRLIASTPNSAVTFTLSTERRITAPYCNSSDADCESN